MECQRRDLEGAAAARVFWERANLKTPRSGTERTRKRRSRPRASKGPREIRREGDGSRRAQEEGGR